MEGKYQGVDSQTLQNLIMERARELGSKSDLTVEEIVRLNKTYIEATQNPESRGTEFPLMFHEEYLKAYAGLETKVITIYAGLYGEGVKLSKKDIERIESRVDPEILETIRPYFGINLRKRDIIRLADCSQHVFQGRVRKNNLISVIKGVYHFDARIIEVIFGIPIIKRVIKKGEGNILRRTEVIDRLKLRYGNSRIESMFMKFLDIDRGKEEFQPEKGSFSEEKLNELMADYPPPYPL